MRNAAPAQAHGMRKAGTKNILKPVAMPSGGMMILRNETAVRTSRNRQAVTAMRPASEMTMEVPGGSRIEPYFKAFSSLAGGLGIADWHTRRACHTARFDFYASNQCSSNQRIGLI